MISRLCSAKIGLVRITMGVHLVSLDRNSCWGAQQWCVVPNQAISKKDQKVHKNLNSNRWNPQNLSLTTNKSENLLYSKVSSWISTTMSKSWKRKLGQRKTCTIIQNILSQSILPMGFRMVQETWLMYLIIINIIEWILMKF